MANGGERFLCIASYEKGQDFLRQCADEGVLPTLLTIDKLESADWPRESLEGLSTMPAGLTTEQIRNTVTWMARGRNSIASPDRDHQDERGGANGHAERGQREADLVADEGVIGKGDDFTDHQSGLVLHFGWQCRLG